MAKAIITKEIQQKVSDIIDTFNKKASKKNKDFMYIPKFKGDFLYLNRKEYDKVTPVARLKYTGDIKKWEFAIYKWSTRDYDADEYFFPGEQHVDGTVEGAMRAGLEAYPV